MEDLVTSRVNYARLEDQSSPVKIRLNSTGVHVKHRGDPTTSQQVDVTYLREGKAYSVHSAYTVLAGYNMMIPYICPELPEPQRKALAFGVKAPLVYTNVLISNWNSWHKLGVHHILALNSYHTEAKLDFPVSLGKYQCPRTPDEPIVLHLEKTPLKPGLPRREQHRAGRMELLSTSFENFERKIRDQLGRMLGSGGFDPARDIEAITVNRWPHGYAAWRDPLTDPDWLDGQQPWVLGRKRFGRIAIANSDSGASALTQTAIDQALRAVRELSANSAPSVPNPKREPPPRGLG
jgi:spermidine dehydrogenase